MVGLFTPTCTSSLPVDVREEILLYPQAKLYPLSKFEFGIAACLLVSQFPIPNFQRFGSGFPRGGGISGTLIGCGFSSNRELGLVVGLAWG
jgi:hypothetical protein